MIDLWHIWLDRPLPGDAWAVLSDSEQRRAQRMRFAGGQRDYVLSHYASRDILARYAGTTPAGLEFWPGTWGKPTAVVRSQRPGQPAGAPVSVEFSLSHTDGLALIAVCASPGGVSVGVDVEAVREIPSLDGLISRCLTSAEAAAVTRADDATKSFLEYWTAKESYLKGLGTGLYRQELDRLEVRPDGAGVLRIARDGATDWSWEMSSVSAGPGYVATLAMKAREREAPIRVLRAMEWPGIRPRRHP